MDWRSRLRAPSTWACLGLYAGAFALRYHFIDAAPYFDEGAFYFFSIHFWHIPATLRDVYGAPVPFPNYTWFWERPLFYLIMSPAAHISFRAYRVFSILLASAIPVVAVMIVRAWGVRRWLAYASGLAVAVLPGFFAWGPLVYMDPVMTLFAGIGLWAWAVGRRGAAMAVLAASVMVKMTSVIVFGFLLAASLWDGLRAGEVRVWPLKVRRDQVVHALLLPVSLGPYLYDYSIGYGFPGSHYHELYWRNLVETMFVVSYFVPVLALGLIWPRTRRWCLLAFLLGASFLYLHVVAGRNVERWYAVLPSFVSLLAVALTIDEGIARGACTRRSWAAWASRGIAVVLAIVVVGLVLVPTTSAFSKDLRPVSRTPERSFQELDWFEHHREEALVHAVDALGPREGHTVFVVDLYFSFTLHPVATGGGETRWGGTWPPPPADRVPIWAAMVESNASRSIFVRTDHALSLALWDTYHDCKVWEDPGYLVVEGAGCTGRLGRLQDEYAAQLAAGKQ